MISKFWRTFFLIPALVLSVLSSPAERIVFPVSWLEPLQDSPVADKSFQPYNGTVPPGQPTTAFRVTCNEFFLGLEIELTEPTLKSGAVQDNILEIFFQSPRSGKAYYQLYGSARDRSIAFYPRGKTGKFYPFLKDWQASYRTNGDTICVRILFPWETFLYLIPEDNEEWQFNIVRGRNGIMQTWQGELHRPEQWGGIRFPKFTTEQKCAMYRCLIRRLADRAAREDFPFDANRFNNRSFLNWKTMVKTQFAALAAEADTVDAANEHAAAQYAAVFHSMRNFLETREFIDAVPGSVTDKNPDWSFFTGKKDKNGRFTDLQPMECNAFRSPWSFTAPKGEKADGIYRLVNYTIPSDGNYYMTNFAASLNANDILWEVALNGKSFTAGNFSELPLNIQLGNLKKGDILTVAAIPPAKTLSFTLDFAIEKLHNGLLPGKAINVKSRPGVREAVPKLAPDGSPADDYLARQLGHIAEIRRMRDNKMSPRVFFIGDSITDGFRGQAWSRLAKYNPVNLGISGDTTQNVIWRLQHGIFEEYNPELAVLLIGTNNHRYSIQEVADSVKAILELIQKKSPETKILLLGIFPRGKEFPVGCRIDKINDILKTYADGNTVFYQDIGSVFMTDKRVVRKDLLPDLLHPNQAGYDAWIDAITPMLEKLLPER